MTTNDILLIPMTQVARFSGDDLAAFCDLFQHRFRQLGDWETIREATAIIGMPDPPLYLDESNDLWIGNALGRDWYIENQNNHWSAVERSFTKNKSS